MVPRPAIIPFFRLRRTGGITKDDFFPLENISISVLACLCICMEKRGEMKISAAPKIQGNLLFLGTSTTSFPSSFFRILIRLLHILCLCSG